MALRRGLTDAGSGVTTFLLVAVGPIELLDVEFLAIGTGSWPANGITLVTQVQTRDT